MSNNAHELSNRLLNALDNNYNVVDMHTVNEIISILERINITKELLETTRLGKHVNELRRKTTEPTLARRAKVLVKRWRDLVIPAAASPLHTGSNRSSAERQVRRLGGTPITSPAFARQVVSPAVPCPRPPSRPAWGGYESDSQDVILVDDDPPAPPAPAPAPPAPAPAPAPAALPPALTVTPAQPSPLALNAHRPATSPAKRSSPETSHDDKRAKRDKKPKRRRGHSRAGSGAESAAAPAPAGAPGGPVGGAPGAWAARNGTHSERKKNGVRNALDPYAALVNRMPPAGAKKVKTTKELLAQIQSRGSRLEASPASPASLASHGSPASPDVMVIEPDEPSPVKAESPLRNGGTPAPPSPAPAAPSPEPLGPLEDEREVFQCTCGEEEDLNCPAAPREQVLPEHIRVLHNAYVPGVNGTRAPLYPHQFAVRKLFDPERPELFSSIVPLYNYSDYADDYCVKNLVRVPLCTHLPWTEFAPPPPSPPAPPSPPPIRPYPFDEPEVKAEVKVEAEPENERLEETVKVEVIEERTEPVIEPEMVSAPTLEPSERLKAPLIEAEDEPLFHSKGRPVETMDVEDSFEEKQHSHRTVARTKEELDGKALGALCKTALESIPFNYEQALSAPTVQLSSSSEVLSTEEVTVRDERGRPERRSGFAEWHECAKLGELIALPYVVLD